MQPCSRWPWGDVATIMGFIHHLFFFPGAEEAQISPTIAMQVELLAEEKERQLWH